MSSSLSQRGTQDRNPTTSTFDNTHWQALLALIDAVIPSVVEGETPPTLPNHLAVPLAEVQSLYRKALCGSPDRFSFDEFRHYMASRASDDPQLVATVKRAVERFPPSAKGQLRLTLDLMLTRFGSLISTGYWTPLIAQPLAVRAAILRSWQRSWFFLWPALARIFITISKTNWSQTNQLYLQLNSYQPYDVKVSPGPSADFKFLQIQESIETVVVEADAVIVGSGCGGAVCAKVLAEAGLKVVVVERGYYFAPREFPMALDRVDNILQGGGMVTADGSTLVTAGSCWGGGGTVNWSASLRTPDYVCEEWARDGLTFFREDQFQKNLDRVCEAMGVSDDTIKFNHSNEVLLEGSRKLGWQAKACPQNSGGKPHLCGSSCGLGCRTGTKQGSASFWLPAAARAGATFIEGLDVSQILFSGTSTSKVMGVAGQWTSRGEHGELSSSRFKTQQSVEVHAKTVILAGGALNTPLLMKRSGLKNPNIGKNLHMHPVANIVATWDQEVKPWEGDILSSVITEFENLDGAGHGAKIESLAMQPYVAMLLNPWRDGIEFKAAALQYRHMTCHISLCRDRDSGSVTAEPLDGSPVINYTPSKFDRSHITTGLVAAAKLCYLSGARSLAPAVPDVPPFEPDVSTQPRSLKDLAFAEWLSTLEKTSLDPLRTTFNSAHQMGTARMGISVETSVVDSNGRVWGCDNLYVADTSVFPSASGVNPMVTVMAIADRIANGIASKLN
ncbi:FAD/NAD(P)-binding domain-containing protein [Xylariaceae sp. FL1272]|nr:FAD/NAD(P)-binding domain-containing protein [Xylariaceae sp. FL1272]